MRLLLLAASLLSPAAPRQAMLEAQLPAASIPALKAGLAAWRHAVSTGAVSRADVLTVIDYSRPSTEPRLFVIDVPANRVTFAELVAHGRGSGENATRRFSNAAGSLMTSLGVFRAGDPIELIGVEAGGTSPQLGHNAATIGLGSPGVLQGSFSYLLQDEHGQIQETHSVSAGLDYPGVGPEHSWLAESGRVRYESATDDEALAALYEMGRKEGILPALEPAHALAVLEDVAAERPGARVLVGLSGRGDKDMDSVRAFEAAR